MEDLILIGKAVFLKKSKTLILGDTHIGLERAMNQNGFLIPRFQHEDLKKTTLEYIKKTNPEKIILNGDVKHEFGKINKQEWKQTEEYIKLLNEKAELIILEGNHDKLLKIITDKQKILLKDHYVIDSYLITHGDKIIKKENIHTIIIGHDHPAISLQEGGRQETYKCFLKGTYEDKTVLVMPSMHELTEGTDILKQKLMSPYIKNINDFEITVVADEPLNFGKLKEIKKLI